MFTALNVTVKNITCFGAFFDLNRIDRLLHITDMSWGHVGHSSEILKIDKGDRRIGLSIRAANYSNEQLKAEQAALDALKPGEDLVALQHAFDAADEAVKQEEQK